jgi:hypothetical protein
MTVWAVGAFVNLWQEMVLHRQNEMYRASILAFNLAAKEPNTMSCTARKAKGRYSDMNASGSVESRTLQRGSFRSGDAKPKKRVVCAY